MDGQEATVKIKNVVASGSLDQRLDLETILKFSPGLAYKPRGFPGVIYRLRKPKTSIIIFGSGKMICTGARSEKEARKAILKLVEEFRRSGIVILNEPDIKVQNVVATAELSGRIDLEKIALAFSRTVYEPDQFPALIHRMEDPEVSVLLFASGKIVCAGARNEREARIAIAALLESLKREGAIYRQASERSVAEPIEKYASLKPTLIQT